MTFSQSEGYRMKHTSCKQFDWQNSHRRFFLLVAAVVFFKVFLR